MQKTPLYRRPGAKEGSTDTFARAERKKFYHSKEWRAFRKQLWARLTKQHHMDIVDTYITQGSGITPAAFDFFISQASPYCVQCFKNKELTPASVLDHIIPIKDGGAELSVHNMQPLCSRCHNIKSAKEQ